MSQGNVYQRQVDRILTGGFNTLTPGDLKEATEACVCENWRVNSAGNLRSRLGSGGTLLTQAGAENVIINLNQVKGATLLRYAATLAGNVFRNGYGGAIGEFGAGPLGMCSFQGFMWLMSNTLQMRDDGTALVQWNMDPPADPTLTPTLGGALVIGLIYTYWVTYVSATGEEGPPNADGVDTVAIAAPNAATTITSPGPSTGATFYNIYRIGNTLEAAMKLNITPILLGVDFVDSGDPADGLDDIGVERIGVTLDVTASGPPPGNGLAGPYFGRLLAWGTIANPNRLFYSATLQPYNFSGWANVTGNWVDLGELGEAIVGVSIRPRMAVIYKDSSIWRLIGDPGDVNATLERVTSEVGLIGVKAMVSKGTLDYFQASEGLYSFNGESAVKITGKLDPLFRGEAQDDGSFSADLRLDTSIAAKQTNCLEVRNGRLYFFYCTPGDAAPSRGVTSELGADNWATDNRGVTAIFDEGQNGLLMSAVQCAGVESQLMTLEEGDQDTTGAIALVYHSGYKDQGAPEQIKMYADVVIEHSLGGASLVVSAFYNSGVGAIPKQLTAISEPLGTITSTAKATTVFQCNYAGDRIGVQAKNIAIRIEGDNNMAPAMIYKILVHYFIEPRDSKTYDSDETDLGTQDVKSFTELELDLDYPASGGGLITWTMYSDRPGGVVIPQDSNTIAATAGRVVLRIPFDPMLLPIEGRLARVTLRCDTSTFLLYGIRLKMLALPEYYDGGINEFFQMLPFGIGIG